MYARLRCGGNLPLCLAFGTGEGLLRYGICVPCSKRLPGVRDAFSEAFGAQNRLLRYGRDIRCQKQPSVVRDASSKARRTADSTARGQPPGVRDAFSEALGAKNRLLRYGRDIRCQKQPSVVRDASSKARRTADSTGRGQPPVVRDAFSEAYRAKSSTCRTGRIFSARNAHRSEVIRLKRGCIPWKSLRIHPPHSNS